MALALCVPAFLTGASGCAVTGLVLLALLCTTMAMAAAGGAWIEWRISRRGARLDQRNVENGRPPFPDF